MSFHSLASNKSWRDSSESGDNGSETHVTSVIREKERKAIMEQYLMLSGRTNLIILTLSIGVDIVSNVTKLQAIISLEN